MISADVLHNIIEATASFHHCTKEQAHTCNHCDCAEGVSNCYAFEAADGGVEYYNQTKEA